MKAITIDVLRALVEAIDAAKMAGCIDHLDCWPEAPWKWYRPLSNARILLAATNKSEGR